MNILSAIQDGLFGAKLLGESWAPARALLGAMFGLPLDNTALDLYRRSTGRQVPPGGPCSEAWLICGRRSGKSFLMALIGVYLACFRDWREHLGPGEVGTVMLIAQNVRAARVLLR